MSNVNFFKKLKRKDVHVGAGDGGRSRVLRLHGMVHGSSFGVVFFLVCSSRARFAAKVGSLFLFLVCSVLR